MIKTERLILHSWKEEDLAPFAALNADPRVREFFYPTILSRQESDHLVKLFQEHIQKFNFGLFAASLVQTGEFIGFIGLQHVSENLPFYPAVEIGWRLAHQHWGKGYATEGAKAALDYGFEQLNLTEIVAMTTVHNNRSRNVMEKLGMTYNPNDDFDHPKVPDGHPLKKHVLYRITK